MGRYATTRQKVCHQCSTAKAKCDRFPTGCSRCQIRGLKCSYNSQNQTDVLSAAQTDLTSSWSSPQTLIAPSSLSAEITEEQSIRPVHKTSSGTSPDLWRSSANLNFNDLQLTCPINADEISNRWLNPFVPMADQSVKNYPSNVAAFIFNTLKSYAAVSINGSRLPPFVHPTQMVAPPLPLSTCFSLVRIFQTPIAGSETALADILQQQMTSLCQRLHSYDPISLLAVFQAYLIYAMVLFFRGPPEPTFLRQAMMNLQELACETARQGLVCLPQQHNVAVQWESWIVAEAKRRTLYTMYLFDSSLSAQEGLPTYLGTELRGLPAPMSQALWDAPNRQTWSQAYNKHGADWTDGSLSIDELWPIPPDTDRMKIADRRKRVNQWLEGVDAYGMMMYTVTSCTHGG